MNRSARQGIVPGASSWLLPMSKKTLFLALAAAGIAASGMGLEAALPPHTMGGEQYVLIVLVGLWAERKLIVFVLAAVATALTIFCHPEILSGFGNEEAHQIVVFLLTWALACFVAVHVERFQGLSRIMRDVQPGSKDADLRLVQTLDSLPEGFALFDADDRLVICNQQFRDFMPDAGPDLLVGRTFEEILRDWAQAAVGDVPINEDWIAQRLARHRDPGEPFEFQLTGGIHVQISERRLDDGTTVSLVTDISNTKAHQEELRRKEERFSTAFRATPGAISITSSETGILRYVNETWERTMGFASDEVLDRTSIEFDIWEHAGDCDRLLHALHGGRRVESFEVRFRTKSGAVKDFTVGAELITFDDEPCLLIVAHDVTARVRAEHLLKQAFQAIPGCVSLQTLDEGILLDVNDMWQDRFGVSREDAVGKRILDIADWWVDDSRDAIAEVVRREGRVREREVRFRNKEGIEWTSLTFAETFVLDDTDCLMIVSSDITNLKEAQELLEKSFHASPSCISLFRLEDEVFVDVNDAWLQTNGYSREEIVGAKQGTLHTWQDQEQNEQFKQALRTEGSVRGREVGLRSRQGREWIGLISAEKVTIAGQDCLLAVTHDITERKAAEELIRQQSEELERNSAALERSDTWFRQFCEIATDWFWETDTDGRFSLLSDNWSSVTGLDRASTIGKQRRRLIEETLLPSELADVEKWRAHFDLWDEHEPFRDLEYAWHNADGELRHLTVSGMPLYDAAGKFHGYRGTGQDITERYRIQDLMQRQSDDLKRSNQELEHFAYVASHDLQEPLRMVTSYVQLLARRYQGKLDSEADEFIAFAVDGAVRMQNLINGLLALSRVGSEGAEIATVDAVDVLDETLNSLRLAIEQNGATVTQDSLPKVMADRVQLGQLFQNLIGNALKFRAEAAPKIHVSARRENGSWAISVRDNGIGIDPQYAERVFNLWGCPS